MRLLSDWLRRLDSTRHSTVTRDAVVSLAMPDCPSRVRGASGGRGVAALLVAVAVAACASGDDAAPGASGAAPQNSVPIDRSATPTTSADTTEAAVTRCAPAASGTDDEVTTLRIWHGFDGDAIGFFEDVVAGFESEHPGSMTNPFQHAAE